MSENTMAGVWMITQADGEMIGGEYSWVYGGKGEKPDFVGWWDYLEDDPPDEPVVVIAERFYQTEVMAHSCGPQCFEREVVRRTYRSACVRVDDDGWPEVKLDVIDE